MVRDAVGRRRRDLARRRVLLALTSLLFCVAAICATPASASRGLTTGFADPLFGSPNASVRQAWLGRAHEAGAGLVRIHAFWSLIAPTRPANPTDPSDPAYSFDALDAAVTAAVANGLSPLVTVTGAPGWAEGPGRPQGAAAGAWKPDPSAFGQFGAALAKRYSGGFAGLPRVKLLQAWNEPNLDIYLAPQWDGKTPVGAIRYRSLLNAFYAGVKSVLPDDTVISGGTAPFGDPTGGHRTRPVAFWRAVLCVQQRKGRLSRAKCPKGGKANLDVLAHHPINALGPPARRAVNRDDASSADLFRVTRVLRAAERFHTVKPGGHRPIWATETWWETNPLDGLAGVDPVRQAHRLEQALYLIWKGGGSVAINLQIADAASHEQGGVDQSGVFRSDGTPKPSLTAFQFPFVADRIGHRVVRAWGKSPAGGTLVIERARGGNWRTLRRISVGAGQVFTTKLHLRKKTQLRASVAGQTSLVWTQR
jgi:hypothetical protein